ncbi:MAG: FtsX-like permease family protein [Chloroflexota bacterium]
MTLWLLRRDVRHAPRRLVLEAIGVAFPVAMLAATLLFVDAAVQAMTPIALDPVQVELRAVAKSLDVDVPAMSRALAGVPGVRLVEPFAATNVVVDPGNGAQVTARLFAVSPAYLEQHPWVRLVNGDLAKGPLLDQSIRASAGFDAAKSVTISLPGDAPPLSLSLPVGGTVDLRGASTWFSIPYGEVQGDIVTVPRSLVIDFATFQRDVLPVLRSWAAVGGLPPFDPGSDELPSASLEAHVSVDHASYPADPGQAAVWSGQLQRVLARRANAPVVVADNAAEALIASQDDATNAKILFLLLGIPGVLVAGALGLAGASTLVEAHRRDSALLRLRGATSGQMLRLAAAHAVLAGVIGSVIGLLIATVAVSAVSGRPVWQGVPAEGLALSGSLAVAAGALVTLTRIIRLRRAAARSDIASERRILERGWSPLWLRAHLDFLAVGVGVAILALNVASGGLKQSPIEGPSLALSFYVLLAPIAIWIGATLLLIRGVLAVLGRVSRPDAARPVSSWRGATLRWLGRRPARSAVSLTLASLAIAFATLVLTFGATYRTAREIDARAAIGSDLRLTPGDPRFALPTLGPDVAAVSPVRLVPARVETDRKTILALDLSSYADTASIGARMLEGAGIEGLAADPHGVLIDSDIAQSFEVKPGDMLPLTIFPDDFENASDIELHVVGVFSSFPPTSAAAELVTSATALPRADKVPVDFYLARVAPGRVAQAVATTLRAGPVADRFGVVTVLPRAERGLTALDLEGLGAIEAIGAGLIAAVGVAVLGAFLILERRREFAILHTLGADTHQILTGPAFEGLAAVLGSLAIGVPLGLLLGILDVRVLGLFFTLSPPLVTVPVAELLALCLFMVVTSAAALGGALLAVNRVRASAALREL